MPINTLEALFTHELKDVYDAEKRLTKALPKMAKSAGSEELKRAFQEHLEVTKNQVTRLEEIFRLIETKPQAKTCEGMKGLIAEGEETMGEDAEETLLDLALIGAARRVEHYEIAAYQSLAGLAANLAEGEQIQELIQQTIDEEEETDRMLMELAESLVEDVESEATGEEDEEEDDEELEEEEVEDEEEVPTPAPGRKR